MFESGGSADDIRAQADKAVAALLADLSLSQVEENKWCAVRVHTAYDLLDARLCAEAELDRADPGSGDFVRACRAAESEAGVALRVSKTAAATMLDVGEALCHRLPLVDADFTAGLIGLSRVQVIVGVLSRASTDTVIAIEGEVLAAAHRLSVSKLRKQIWALWFAHDPDEAEAARADADAASHKVYTRNADDGAVELIARLSACSIAEVNAVLDQMISTVCAQDPRTPQQLRCAAFAAVFRHQIAIPCECGRGEDCPVWLATGDQRPPVSWVLNVYADLPTLLGLLDETPHLPDGTPLDPQMAQWVLTNARMRGLLIELRDLARQEFPDAFDADGKPTAEATAPARTNTDTEVDETAVDRKSTAAGRDAAEESDTADADTADAPDAEDSPSSAPVSRTPDHASRTRPRTSVRLVRRRTKSRPALNVPPPPPPTGTKKRIRRGPRLTRRERELGVQIQDLLTQIHDDPSLARGVDPTGHGRWSTPLPGALVYRPSAELAACVRATYPTCVFSGCDIPAEQCELDHTVPFDHQNPLAGGWTIPGNLAPLCKNHHQAKTERSWTLAILEDGFLCWTTRSGLIRITAPETWDGFWAPMVGGDGEDGEVTIDWGTPDNEPPKLLPDDISAPTWWEEHWPEDSDESPPDFSLDAIARTDHPQTRRTLRFYRTKKQEHDRIVEAREFAEECPY